MALENQKATKNLGNLKLTIRLKSYMTFLMSSYGEIAVYHKAKPLRNVF